MKKIFFSVLFLSFFGAEAQEKSLLVEGKFWQSNPSIEKVKTELSKGFDFKNIEGFKDPILSSMMNGASQEVVLYLMNLPEVNLFRQVMHERTYLHIAAQKDLDKVVEFLLSKGLNINAPDDKEMTPIVYAVSRGNPTPKTLEIFFKNGVDVKKKYASEKGADLLLLGLARDKGLKLTDYFISKGLSLKSTDKDGNGAFYYSALVVEDLENLKELKKRKIKYDDRVLLALAQGGHRVSNGLQGYQYLIEELKLNPKITNDKGQTLLHLIASKPKQEEVIRYLLNKGVEASKLDNEGNSPFILSARGSSLPVVEALFSFQKNVNATNKKGENALYYAVKNGSAEIVKFLLDKGADISFKTPKNENLAFVLIDGYHPRANAQFFEEKFNLLKSKGLDFSSVMKKDGSTALHIAVTKNEIDLLKKIVKLSSITIDKKNNEGFTPLHKAALVAKDTEILKYLLSLGADKTIKTDADETSYDLAKENELLTKNKINIEFLK